MIPLLLIQAETRSVEFRLTLDAPAKSVVVAGTFNNWNREATPLRSADGKTWTGSASVPYGTHQYKFVVDGERWLTDPAGKTVDDGNGNQNSLLLVVPPDYAAPARPRDGVIARSALRHDAADLARTYDRGLLTFRLRTRPDDVADVRLTLGKRTVPLVEAGRDDLYATWTARVPWDGKRDLAYSFRVDGETVGPYRLDAKTFRPFVVPSWPERSFVYQIFPDRFDNGDPANDPKDVQAWDAKPTYFNRFGGDVAGVRRRLDYLESLGVDAVYFNPVFKSPSNHRYEADSYLDVDPQFGTNDEFAALGREMKGRGMGMILDLAFNHTSPGFFAFQDVIGRGEASDYRDWYFIKRYPVRVQEDPPYEAWFGFPSMPKLNTVHPATQDYLLGVVPFWRKTVPNLVGVRLDVGNEVDPNFWRAFRPSVKAQDPNLWIVGEVWGDGTPWLGGDQWDATMNYPFREAVLRGLGTQQDDVRTMMGRLQANVAQYPPQVSRNMMNLIGSHDTPRFLTLAGGDRDRLKLAALVQFGWVGSPCVYYGDELGMEGGADPDNRRGMRWDLATADNDVLRHYRRLAEVRRRLRALQSGDARLLFADADAALWERTLGKSRVFVAFNRAATPRKISASFPADFRDVLGTARVDRRSILLPPRSGTIVALPLPRTADSALSSR